MASTRSVPGSSNRGVPVEPVFVALATTGGLAVALVHGIAAPLRALTPGVAPVPATGLTVAVLALALLHAGAQWSLVQRSARRIALSAAVLAAGALSTRYGASAAALVLAAAAQIWTAGAVADRLRARLSGVSRRRPLASGAWALLGAALLLQSARLSTFMADPSVDYWLTTREPLWAQHMCMPAYVQAADLVRQGEGNPYDATFYPVLTRTASPSPWVRNIGPWIGDPFQYPPPFLLWPRLALMLTDDFLVMRTEWYVMQLLLFLGAALALSAWIGGDTGWAAALLIPALWLSLPAMQSLQYGQAHMAAVSLGLLGMISFERRHAAVGGALLATATMAKIFPGVLILWLVAQRRWRDLMWTAAMGALLVLIALTVLGAGPFRAFVSYQLPRLSSGAAFDFSAQWPEFANALAADNLSPAGVVEKLAAVGVPGMTRTVAGAALRLYTLAVVVAAFVLGRRHFGTRRRRAVVWLALLNLAALQSYGAWGDYVTLGTAWLVTLAVPAPQVISAWRIRGAIAVSAVLFFVVPGVQPIPELLPLSVAVVLTTLITTAMIVLNTWAVYAAGVPRNTSAARPSPVSV